VLLAQTVVFADDNYYQRFAAWLTDTNPSEKTKSLTAVCTNNANISPENDCNAAADAQQPPDSNKWTEMCSALGSNHPCPEASKVDDYKSTIQNIHGCCLAVCNDIKDIDKLTFATPEACCAACAGPDNGIPKPNPTTKSVGYFLNWAGEPNTGIVAGSCHAETPNVKKDCEEASKRGTPAAASPSKRGTPADDPSTSIGTPDNWTEMCAALADFDCTSSDPTPTDVVDTFTKCCNNNKKGGCSDTTKTGTEQVQCCADCITSSETTPAPPSPSDSSHSGDGEPTTTPSPGPSPTPSSSGSGDDDTTTKEPSTTDGGSDSDSAINIGASGLLVTLITMMAAGVNIA